MSEQAGKNKLKVTRPFGIKDQLGYMIGNIGNDLTFFLASNFFMVFYTNVIGVSAAIVGNLFGIARLVDAFTDVSMGAIADNSKTTPVGKFKPWLKRMAFPVGIISALMYNYFISDWNMSAKIVYMSITYLLWGSIFYTSINIPYGSLASVISGKSEDRASLSTFRSIGSTLIQFLLGVLVPAVTYTTSGEVMGSHFTMLAIVLGLLAAVAYLICYNMVQERVQLPQNDEGFSLSEFFGELAQLIKDRGFLALMFSTMFVLAGMISLSQLMQYMFLDYFQNTNYLKLATAGLTIAGLVAAPFVSTLTRRFGKKEAGAASLIGTGLIYIVTNFLNIEDPFIFSLIVILAGIVLGYYMMAMYSYVTDVIDDFQIKYHERKDGTIYAVYSFTRKVGQALAGVLAGNMLQWIGYVSGQNVTQTPEVTQSIYNVGTLLPGGLFLIAGLILAFMYPLNKKRVNENVETIAKIQAEEN
ncbi:MFS transporter [Aerococcus kribbianus]|uniref:Glycoside-pentoside-hexuronide (GPH):cation symporter n=1 Tax=Aerococcus kribbianus TaxID=2999064 RepID=A0A9X3FR78_9LACT|nr:MULTISPECIES: glycoside-pentoside-hexuronide (GPH):cation symporter [unclassified Aerococcus]MCZ0716867.1 glycoside-pentoside-hexuronide (GPH):cation symporter [Aerococcus sp. YH-aer221]MCZ0725155.1 glycoside-pentoside-hexuronide (GPH):cation symporter [Aerococcus sp. YH-aer222]